jgi:Mn2+/Fe2+ NRAMP family transporter
LIDARGVLVIATTGGALLNFTALDPIKAINGVVAVPVLTVMMLMTARPQAMGKFTISGGFRWLGWITTALMGACVAAMAWTWSS